MKSDFPQSPLYIAALEHGCWPDGNIRKISEIYPMRRTSILVDVMVWHRLTRILKVELVASGIIFFAYVQIFSHSPCSCIHSLTPLTHSSTYSVAMGTCTLHTRKERCIVQEVQKLGHRWSSISTDYVY